MGLDAGRAGLYTFLLAWNAFLFAVVLIESVTEWNMLMAFSVLASAPLVVALIFLQRYVGPA